MEKKQTSLTFYTSIIIIALFILGRLYGDKLFDNHWSFNHWSYLPTWYVILWLVVFGGVIFLFIRYFEKIGLFFSPRRRTIIGLPGLFIITIILHFDSFLYGGGNLRVAMIGQTDKIIYHWYELGTTAVVAVLFHLFNLFPLNSVEAWQTNIAAVWAWRTLAYLSTALSIVGTACLIKELKLKTENRFYLFIIMFFGSQSLLYLGFIGMEPVIVAVTIWFAWATVKATHRFSFGRLLWLWLITLVGVVMHLTALYLLPALLYLTFTLPFKKRAQPYFSIFIAFISLVALIFLAYQQLGASLKFSQYLLFINGHLPRSDYGLFSCRHIGDMLQLFFLAIPMAIVMKITGIYQKGWLKNNPPAIAGWLVGSTGAILVFIANPVNNIVLDFPRFTAYLTAFSFLMVLVLTKIINQDKANFRIPALIAAAALMLPFSYLPPYVKIEQAKYYLEDYLQKNESYYRTGLIAVRDAHFYRGEFKSADYWEWQLPVKSLEYLNLKGTRDLIAVGRNEEALTVLYQEVSRNPFWTEPRDLIAMVQMNLGRFELAKPQIDTCLMLEPYNKVHLNNLYRYYRDSGNLFKAREVIDRQIALFPRDNEVRTDEMIINYRLGKIKTADSLAELLMATDARLPFPYLIKGFISENSDQASAAIRFYQKFIELGPTELEIPMVEKKLDSLQSLLKNN